MRCFSSPLSKFTWLIIFAMAPSLVFAQANYQPGYVINLKGDTLKGFVNYKDWDLNPATVEFKTNPGADKQTFTVHDIRLFNINGLYTYQKAVCSISTDEINPSQLSRGRDTSFKIDTVFLKVLQQGPRAALYVYTDEQKTRFYLGKAPSFTPVELPYHLYIGQNSSGDAKTVTDEGYKKELFALASQYNVLDEKLSTELQRIGYNKDELLPVMSTINGISEADFEKHHGEHGKLSWFATVAADVATTSSEASSGFTAGGGVSSTSILPAAGVGLNYNPSPIGGRVEFRAEFSIDPTRENALYTLKVSPYGSARTSYNQTSFFISPQLIFHVYKSQNLNVHLGIGLALSYSMFSNQYFQSQSSANNPYFPREPFYFNHTNNGFLIKGGFTIENKWEVYFDYVTATSTTGGDYFYLSNQVKRIGVAYFFN